MAIPNIVSVSEFQFSTVKALQGLETAPIMIAKHNKVVAVVLSVEEYERLTEADQRLQRILAASSNQ